MSISAHAPLLKTIVQNRFYLRVLAFAFALICLIIFNLKNPSGPSARIRAYDAWLGVVERNEVDAEGKPLPVSISLVSKDSQNPFTWSLSADTVAKRRTIVRILQLLREAEIETLYPLAKDAHSPVADDGILLLTTKNETGAFYAEIPPRKVKDSIQLQNMIKLFQVVQLSN